MNGVAQVRLAVARLDAALSAVPPDSPVEELVELCAHAEHLAAAAKLTFARRLCRAPRGHTELAGFLAEVSGEPIGRAREDLAVAEKVAEVPALEHAFLRGELSQSQAKVLADIGEAGLALLGKHGSFKELRDDARSIARRNRGEESLVAREAKVHARRYLRSYEPDTGGIRIDALLPKADGARILARLEATARRGDPAVDFAARMADALIDGCCDAQMVVRVDAGALVRGHCEGDEVCEIPGIGPIPVKAARSFLGDALLSIVVERGADIACVTSATRVIPRAVRTALYARDRTCVVPNCGVSTNLEIDHWQVDFAKGGLTSLENLARLCSRHHAMKTSGGWRLSGGPGRWKWRGPPIRSPG